MPTGVWQSWVLARFPAYSGACLVAAVFLVPVLVHTGAPDPAMLVKLSTAWFLGVCATAFMVMVGVEFGRRPSARLARVAIAYGVASIVATILSDHPLISVIGLTRRYGGLVPQLLYLTVMLVIVATYRDRPSALNGIAWATAAASTAVSIYVLLQASGIDPVGWNINGVAPEYPVSTLGNSNFAGGYLAIALPLSLYIVSRSSRGLPQALAATAVGLQVLAVWYTHTRGGLLAALAAILFMTFLARHRLSRMARVVASTTAVALALGLLLIVWHPGLSDAPGPVSLVRTSTLENRVAYWRSAWRMFVDHPIVGTGPDTFAANYGRYEAPGQALKEPLIITDKPHNIFLERATNSGILGAASYIVLFGLALLYGYRQCRREPQNRALLVAFLGSLVAYLGQGFFSIDVPPLAFMGWVVLGAVVSLADPGVIRASAIPNRAHTFGQGGNRHWRRAAHALTVLCATALIALGIRPLRADIAAGRGDLVSAIRLQPLEASYHMQAGDVERAQASTSGDPTKRLRHLTLANSFYLQAVRLQPDNVHYATTIAGLNTWWAQAVDPARFDVADRWWRRALAKRPRDPALRDYYVAVRAGMQRTVVALERTAAAGPQDHRQWLRVARGYLALEDVASARAAAARAHALAPGDVEVSALLATIPS